MKEPHAGMHGLVVHLENQIQMLLKEGKRMEQEARELLSARLSQVHTLQDEVSSLRAQLAAAEQTEPLREELERLHREVEAWRQQHADLHLAWQADRRSLEEWQRRWGERQRIAELAQQIRRTMDGSACS